MKLGYLGTELTIDFSEQLIEKINLLRQELITAITLVQEEVNNNNEVYVIPPRLANIQLTDFHVVTEGLDFSPEQPYQIELWSSLTHWWLGIYNPLTDHVYYTDKTTYPR